MLTRLDVVVRAALAALVMAAVPASGFGQGAPAPAQPRPPSQPAPAQPAPAQPVPAHARAPGADPRRASRGDGTPPSQAAPVQEQKGGVRPAG